MSKRKIRISCASLASIKIDGKFLLCLNKSHLKNGLKVYTPFGGAIEYNDPTYLNELEVEFEREERDLRLYLDKINYSKFIKWFKLKQGREFGIERELQEEMIEEEEIFEYLVKDGYTEYVTSFINRVTDISDDGLNHRFFEIFSVYFSEEYIEKIYDNLNQSDTHLYLATETEILNLKTDTDIIIGKNSISIIN